MSLSPASAGQGLTLAGIAISALVIVSLALAAPAPPAPAKAPQDDNLVWSDEFDGTALDPAKWDHRWLGKRRDAFNTKDTVSLDGQGHLLITTRKVGDRYETGMIATAGKFERAFGYFECRAKFQSQPGHWSAFWLMPHTMGRVVGDTKASGTEIDIFEYLPTKTDKIQHTLHWDGYGKDHKSKPYVHTQAGFNEGWHTVGLEWTKDEYVFYVDGKETWRTREAISHAPEYIILSLEVGKWAGDIAQAKLPDSILFDYVRVYKTRPAEAARKNAADKSAG